MAEANSGPAPEPRPPLSLGLSLLPIIALFGAIGISMATVGTGGGALLLSILFAATIAGLVARKAGAGWQEIQQETGRQIADALPAILILLTIGALIGSWMFSGTIPMMVVLGIDLIDPRFMVLTAFVATAVMSLISGTSWGSAGTIGVALMGAAQAMGLPLAPVAGAVVSGAYFGDKLSPLSDMTNIAAIGAGADLYDHIRCMLWTSLPAAAIAVVTFAGLGLAGVSSGTLASSDAALIKSELVGVFDLGPLAALPLLVALVGIALRKPPALVILASSVLALIVGIFGQGFSFVGAVASFVDGFSAAANLTGAEFTPSVENLLNRGGLISMSGTLLFIIAAFLLAAGMKVSGAIDRLLNALLGLVQSAVSLVAATMAAGAIMVAMTSHGGVTALIVGGLFRRPFAERNLEPQYLSRTIEDSVTVTEPLMPWTVSGVFMASTLGVPTLALAPWAVFCWLGPVTSLAAALFLARKFKAA
ncbi:Na+/H+ antiporter NhaC family protein [Qipengyuania pacifica]|uniref:Na+/H+ antiporter NhaC family protein n=1 Tax=Qipengyuania pacifica TaxID=2860199 RepID=UPI001C9DA241|nr:Na+/H+ antiporter NhaC family protein [Qipengyuania pacifica]MBY8333776.1 Na+/H+ antiporter NhaC [Qipengyuania pacifica]